MAINYIGSMRFAVFMVVAVVAARGLLAADWPARRGPEYSGISTETAWTHNWPATGPRVAWRANVGTGFSAVVVSGDLAYTMGNEANRDVVWCLRTADGKVVWRYSYESPLEDRFFEGGPTSTPSIDGDRVYTLGRQGDLYCFVRTNGKVLWSTNVAQDAKVRVPGWGFASSPRVFGEMLLLNVGEAGTAVDKSSGKLIWTSADSDAGYATPVLATWNERHVALIGSAKYHFAVDAETGAELWRHRWLTRFGCNAADPIVSGQQVFISSGYNRGAALLENAGDQAQVVWQNKDMQNQMNSSVLLDGYLYGIDGDTTSEQFLKCLEFKSGKVLWSMEGFGTGSLIAAGNRLIILSDRGELVVAEASPHRFHALARAQVMDGKCWTSPTLANGKLYCRSADGEVVCLDVSHP